MAEALSILSVPRLIRQVSRIRPGDVLALMLFTSSGFAYEAPVSESSNEPFLNSDPLISKLKPEEMDGRGFKLVYSVDAPLDVVWRYKTHFDNQGMLGNKFIDSHRLVSHIGNVAITETEYSSKPKVVFKWHTTIFPEQNLLKYVLLNPQECGQKYHYGYVQLEALDTGTRVTQIAYFDFFGVSLWVNYPFKGGMSSFLKYTAQWEQQFMSEFADQYKE